MQKEIQPKDEVRYFNKLLRKISSGDKDSLEEFYNVYGKLIYITALTVAKSSYLADEIVNDMLVKIWKFLPKKKIKNPKGWLYILTTNLAKDKIRQETKIYEVFTIRQDEIENFLDEDEFYSEIKGLNEIEQKVMIFKFIEDMSFKEISKELKMSLSSVSSIYKKMKMQNFVCM